MKESYYSLISKNLLEYLPSRFLIVLNSLLVIPLLTANLSIKDVGIWLIAIQILNIVCTWSFDWIAKATLRFYEKYNSCGRLKDFLSTTFWLSVFLYALLIILFFIFKNFIALRYSIPDYILLSVLILIIPCGIRQTLYQILRIKNMYKLYTMSIIIYYLAFLLLLSAVLNILKTALAPIVVMNISITLIDIIIIKKSLLDYKIDFSFDWKILKEILIYSCPTVFTNTGYWGIFHLSKLMFQRMKEFQYTAVTGVAWALASSILQPLSGLFSFVTFPVVFKKFEQKRKIHGYLTGNIQMYIVLLLPVVLAFCFYPSVITGFIVPQKYQQVSVILPYAVLTLFLHEFLKINNIKYHLKIKTYIETVISLAGLIFTFYLNLFMIKKYALLGAGIAMLSSEILVIILNMITGSRNITNIKYKPVLKTLSFALIFSAAAFTLAGLVPPAFSLIKLTAYFALVYSAMFCFKNKVLG